MQPVRLGKAGGSADPTVTFPGGALAWETNSPCACWHLEQQETGQPPPREQCQGVRKEQ